MLRGVLPGVPGELLRHEVQPARGLSPGEGRRGCAVRQPRARVRLLSVENGFRVLQCMSIVP